VLKEVADHKALLSA